MVKASTVPKNVTDSTGEIGIKPEVEVITIITAVLAIILSGFIITCIWRCKARRAVDKAILNPIEAVRQRNRFGGFC